MPVVCDYTDILTYVPRSGRDEDGHWVVHVGDINAEDRYELRVRFDTGGRETSHSAILHCVYRRLTTGSVDIKINGRVIGSLSALPNSMDLDNFWHTTLFTFPGSVLRDGNSSNEILLEATPLGNPSPGNLFDDFEIRELVCFFKQDA